MVMHMLVIFVQQCKINSAYILHKQYRFFLYCAPIRMLKQKSLALLCIDEKN